MELADRIVCLACDKAVKIDGKYVWAGIDGRLGRLSGKSGLARGLGRRFGLGRLRVLRYDRTAMEAEGQTVNIQPEGWQQPEARDCGREIIRVMVQVIGRHWRRAEGRQQRNRAKVDGCGQCERNRQQKPAFRPRSAEIPAKNRQAHGRQEQEQQRQPVFGHSMQRDLPKFQNLPAVSHGIGRIKAAEDLKINELRGIKQEEKPAKDQLQHAVQLRRENTAQDAQRQRRNERENPRDGQPAAPESACGHGTEDRLIDAEAEVKERQQPETRSLCALHENTPLSIYYMEKRHFAFREMPQQLAERRSGRRLRRER